MTYLIRLDRFEGPLDLLLSLVEKEELPITEVSLAQITDQFLTYLEAHRDLPLSQLSNFLSVAARLLLIKSRALLPSLTLTGDEESSITDLTARLADYQHYREAALRLETRLLGAMPAYAREGFAGMPMSALPPANLSGGELMQTFVRLRGALPEPEALAVETFRDIIRMEDKMREFEEHLARRAEVSFASLVSDSPDRMTVVVSFLAILELVKRKVIVAHQCEYFGEIALQQQPPGKESRVTEQPL